MYSTIERRVQLAFSKISVMVLLWAASAALFFTSPKVQLYTNYLTLFVGAWNAPKRQRIFNGLCHVRNRAPFLGGNFGLWGGIFSSVDCLLIYYRQKDDPYNAIAAGFITGGVLAIRGGIAVAFRQAMMGGVILLVIETVGNLMNAIMTKRQHEFQAEMQKQELARMKAMYARGGDNPYAVAYDQEQGKNINSLDDKTAIVDNAAVAQETGSFMDKAKKFSF